MRNNCPAQFGVLIMRFPPLQIQIFSSELCSLLKRPQSPFFPHRQRPSFTTMQNQRFILMCRTQSYVWSIFNIHDVSMVIITISLHWIRFHVHWARGAAEMYTSTWTKFAYSCPLFWYFCGKQSLYRKGSVQRNFVMMQNPLILPNIWSLRMYLFWPFVSTFAFCWSWTLWNFPLETRAFYFWVVITSHNFGFFQQSFGKAWTYLFHHFW